MSEQPTNMMKEPHPDADRASLPPKLLYDGNARTYVVQTDEAGVRVSTLEGGESLWLEGRFARMVTDTPVADLPRDPRWQITSRMHPWISGLAGAVETPPSLKNLVVGEELGILFIEVTHRCNERCLHCYASASPEEGAILSLEEVESVLRDAHALGCGMVQFTGGDPLLHPDLPAMVETARRTGIGEVEIFTNGLLLTSNLLDRLAPFAPKFAFSFYSHKPEVHDRITQVPGSQQRTLKAIALAVQRGFRVRAGGIIMEENVGDEDGVIDLLMAQGVARSSIGFDTVKGTGRGTFDPETEMRWHDGESMQEDEHPERVEWGLPVQEEVQADTGCDCGEGDDLPISSRRRGKLCISADAAVYPCIFSRRVALGSIREGGLMGVLSALEDRVVQAPLPERWDACREGLTCSDCQWIAYALTGAES